jgi:hypothetical protein
LLPKSSKHYIVPTAEKLEVPVGFVEDVINFYYSEVRKSLTEMDHFNIVLDNLGSFKIKKKGLTKLKKKYNNTILKNSGESISQTAIREDTEKKLARVLKIEKILNEERERRKQFLKDKYG